MIPFALFVITGCEPHPAAVTEPVGRYQVLPVRIGHEDAEQSAFIVTDTVEGRVTLCRATLTGPECLTGTHAFR